MFDKFDYFNRGYIFGVKTDKYKPYINYDWSTTTASGLRYLKDVGSTPTYNASMYFGRGAYLNGVDQSIEHDTITLSADFTYITTKQWNGNTFDIIHGGATAYIGIANSNSIVLKGTTYTYIPLNTTLLSNLIYNICIKRIGNILYAYINGVEAGNTSITVESISLNTVSRYGSAFGEKIIKDMFIFNRALTQSEITQAYEQPELFYAMAQADSTCVLNMPMCETDGYVRNMKTYSEGDNFSGFTIGSQTTGTGNSITKNNNTFNITNVVSTGQVYYPLVRFTPDVFNSDLYYQEIEVKCVTGTLKVGVIEGNPSTTINEVLTAGQSRVYTKVSGFANLGGQKGVIFLDGLNYPSFTAEVTLRNVRKITNGIHPIQNYTTSVRDNAKNLQYGLQTCKFVRDGLGVIQSASDYLEGDTVGYADTGWVPSADEDWQVECVWYVGEMDASQWRKVCRISNVIKIERNQSDIATIGYEVYGLSGTTSTIKNEYVHILIDSTGKVYLNGSNIKDGKPIKTSTDVTLKLFKYSSTADIGNMFIKLFKVHKIPQDPIKLYNNAQGLLS